jgi:NAD(P)-dependent dehydrogenase (short-subunit alcohol dehydrogenase family)
MKGQDMRAVVMGGTSGIGLATAEQLTAADVDVTVIGRDPARLAGVAGRFAGAERLDGTDRGAVSAFFDGFGEFEHLVLAFSPGAVGLGPIREISLDDFETAFSAKLFAYIHAIRQAQVTESITMISAASARAALPQTVALAAVNGAIERLVSPLAAELAPVRVNAVSPGVVDTPWWSFLAEDQRHAQFEAAAAGVPAARIGTPADIADAIGYLVKASLVTGTILPVDGGFTVA